MNKYEAAEEYVDDECCKLREGDFDNDYINPRSDKFDIDMYEAAYREKLQKQIEKEERAKEIFRRKEKVKKELDYKEGIDDRPSKPKPYLASEKIAYYKQRYFEIRDRQNEIMDLLIEGKQECLFMKGSYVEEYKQLEKTKLLIVDTLMNAQFRPEFKDETLFTTVFLDEDAKCRGARSLLRE